MLPGKATDPGVTAKDDRNSVEGIPVRMRAGSPWRDLPERFGKRTASSSGSADGCWPGFPGVFSKCYRTISIPDTSPSMEPRSRPTGRRPARTGDPEPWNRAFPRWPDGRDRRGHRRLRIPGPSPDPAGPDSRYRGRSGARRGASVLRLVRDRASGADWPGGELDRRGAAAVIRPKRNRAEPREYDREMCGWRCQIENFSRRSRSSGRSRHVTTGPRELRGGDRLVAGVIAAK